VQINPDPRTYVTEPVARYMGTDGKPHSIYTSEYYEKTADPKKFERVEQNRPVLKALIGKQYENLARPLDSRERDVALMNLVAAETGMRRGNLQSAMTKGTYGISTMPANSLRFEGDSAVFKFPGKGGVENTFTVRDPRIVSALKQQQQMATQMGRTELFNTKSIHAYQSMPASSHAKFHDYRTMKGIDVARDAISRLPKPRNEQELGQLMRAVSEHVAKALGNTPDVALQSYVDPRVFDESRQMSGMAPKMMKAAMPEYAGATAAAGAGQAGGFTPGAQPDSTDGQQEVDPEYPLEEDDVEAADDRDGSEYEVPEELKAIWQAAFGDQPAPKTMRVPPEILKELIGNGQAQANGADVQNAY
jgi:DNA topoisomerase-1